MCEHSDSSFRLNTRKEIIDLGYNTARVALGHWLAEAPESTQEIFGCKVGCWFDQASGCCM